MKNNTKSKMEEVFLKILETNHSDLPEHIRRRIAHALTGEGMLICQENSEGLSKMASDAHMDLEQHRKKFRDHIEKVQTHVKDVFTDFRKNGYVRDEMDAKTRKKVLIAKTKVIERTVIFLNFMNETVMDFYENVYKIEEGQEKGIQTTLF